LQSRIIAIVEAALRDFEKYGKAMLKEQEQTRGLIAGE
jgi:hypothetical protein